MKEKYFNILTKKELKKIKKTYLELFREFDTSLLKVICLKELKINNDDSESAHEVYAYLQFLTDSIKLSDSSYFDIEKEIEEEFKNECK